MHDVPLFEAKNRLTALVHEAEEGNPVQLTRHGKPVAVLMGRSDYEKFIGTQRNISTSLNRFQLAWPVDESGEYQDPFADIRSDEGGRRVDL